MNRIFADADVGRKNIGFGMVVFLILGVVVGIPLTVNFMGGSMLTERPIPDLEGDPWVWRLPGFRQFLLRLLHRPDEPDQTAKGNLKLVIFDCRAVWRHRPVGTVSLADPGRDTGITSISSRQWGS